MCFYLLEVGKRGNKMKSILKRVLIIAVAIYFLLVLLVYFFQDNLLFMPRAITEERAEEIENEYPEVEEVELTTPDGIKLHGWLTDYSEDEENPLLIYFGGNAEEVSWLLEESARFKDHSLLLINYRGYGLSEGSPSEENLFNDAVYIYDYIADLDFVDDEEIILMGRSLGTGVAVHLAAQREVSDLILVSPYDSIKSLAKDIFPYLPVELMLRHEFASISKLEQIDSPALFLVAENDEIVPKDNSKKLYQKWPGEKEFKIINNRNHNDIHFSEEYWNYIIDFISD